MQFRGFGNAVVVGILPETQLREDVIMLIDYSISITPVPRLVIFGQREKTVARNTSRRCRLRREVAEHLRAVIYRAIAVAVAHQPGIVRSGRGP